MRLLSLLPICAPLCLNLARLAHSGTVQDVSDHAALIQVGAASSQLSAEGAGSQGKKLVVLLDGTSTNSQGNLYLLYTQLVNDPHKQRTHYTPGVTDQFMGRGVRANGVDAFKFLQKYYEPGDQVFIYGASRGCLSARYVQGLLSKYGMPKKPLTQQELLLPDSFEYSLEAADTWKDVEITVLACIDGVVRTLWREEYEMVQDMDWMYQEITPQVKNFLHAMATDEASAFIFVGEILVPNETHEEQVWFGVDHKTICLTFPIVSGWLAERSQELGGLLLKDGFLEHLDYCDQCTYPAPLDGLSKIRDPMRCRKEIYGGRRIRVHASVQDRMRTVAGWQPLTACCYPDALSDANVEWVDTPAYRAHRHSRRQPQWFKVIAKFQNLSDKDLVDERIYLIISTPHGPRFLGSIAEHKKRVARFGKAIFQDVIPFPANDYYLAGIVGPCIEEECSTLSPSNLTRYEDLDFRLVEALRLDDANNGALHDISFADGKFKVSVELLYNDTDAGREMHVDNPRCAWMASLVPENDLCATENAEDYPQSCATMREQVLDGDWHWGDKHRRRHRHSSDALSVTASWMLLTAPLAVAMRGLQ